MPFRRALPTRRYRPLLILTLVAVLVFLFFHSRPLYSVPARWEDVVPAKEAAATAPLAPSVPTSVMVSVQTKEQDEVHTKETLVPLEAHIMSKCPDARDCLRDLVLPTMMKVHDKVNFTLSFLGR